MRFLRPFRSYSNYFRIKDLQHNQVGSHVTVKAWTKNIRNMKENLFLELNDGSCAKNIQVVVSKDHIRNVNFGSSVEASGELALSPRNQLELRAKEIRIIGNCPPLDGFPFAARHSYPPEYIREHLHLRTRVGSFNSMLRVRSAAQLAISHFLNENKFIKIDTPILTANDCEGGGETFTVRPDNEALLKEMVREKVPLQDAFFDQTVFLTVSGQLHLEAMAHGVGDCYTFGPTFRAENAKSPVHLSEFYMLEVEQCFVPDLVGHLDFVERFVTSVTKDLLQNSRDDIENCHKQVKSKTADFSWVEKRIPIISYKEAAEILSCHSDKLSVPFEIDEGLAKDHELFLCSHLSGPVFVVEWPLAMKPFYMRPNLRDPSLIDAYDLLVPNIGELIGGSLREDDYERLKRKLPAGLDWYAQLRKYGSIPTAGFGLGFERFLQMLLSIHNIRDVIPYPRYPHNCSM